MTASLCHSEKDIDADEDRDVPSNEEDRTPVLNLLPILLLLPLPLGLWELRLHSLENTPRRVDPAKLEAGNCLSGRTSMVTLYNSVQLSILNGYVYVRFA